MDQNKDSLTRALVYELLLGSKDSHQFTELLNWIKKDRERVLAHARFKGTLRLFFDQLYDFFFRNQKIEAVIYATTLLIALAYALVSQFILGRPQKTVLFEGSILSVVILLTIIVGYNLVAVQIGKKLSARMVTEADYPESFLRRIYLTTPEKLTKLSSVSSDLLYSAYIDRNALIEFEPRQNVSLSDKDGKILGVINLESGTIILPPGSKLIPQLNRSVDKALSKDLLRKRGYDFLSQQTRKHQIS